MHRFDARVHWARNPAEDFTGNKYSRRHHWSFDGGARIDASPTPQVVPEPWSDPTAVDPEEALVASASSCHMLFFLALAGRRGLVVDAYDDEAFGVMEPNEAGKLAFSRITLRPKITFAGGEQPAAHELDALHERAHAECYIANSLRCEVVVESP